MLPALLALLAVAPALPERACAQRAEPPQRDYRPASTDVTLGRVSFLGLRGAGRRIAARPPRGDMTMKVGVLVRAGDPVVVRLRLRGRTRARLDYDMGDWGGTGRSIAAGNGQAAIRFVPCPPDTAAFTDGRPLGPWTGYPGGFLVARPGCAVLDAAGVRRRIALGVPPRRCRVARP